MISGRVLGAIAAAGSFLFLAKKSSAITPENVQVRVAEAIASKDPRRMAELSKSLMAQGMTLQAAQLEAYAGVAKGMGAGSPELQKAGLAMVANIRASEKYKENKTLVGAYQKVARDLKVDNKYGPKTAATLATRLNMIPPTPIYWAEKTSKLDKDQYRALLLERAANDTLRFKAWKEAADVIR